MSGDGRIYTAGEEPWIINLGAYIGIVQLPPSLSWGGEKNLHSLTLINSLQERLPRLLQLFGIQMNGSGGFIPFWNVNAYLWGESESEVTACPTFCDPMDCSLPGSSVHGIFQAIALEWIAISFSRGSSQPRDWTRVSHIVGRCLPGKKGY